MVLPASHDTGSAFLAIPARDENAVYISSGTWSLLGVENEVPITTPESHAQSFTNEGGAFGRYHYLKNIMGLWMIQSIRRELNGEAYVQGKENRTKAENLKLWLRLCSVYSSLSKCYAEAIQSLQTLTGKQYTSINIVGGGQDTYLNDRTAQETGLTVYAGPVEGTAIGNIIVQMIAMTEICTLQNARNIVRNSFEEL